MKFDKILNPLAKLGKFARESYQKHKDKPAKEKEEKPRKEPYYTTDKFWLTRWIRDVRYKRVGLTTITYLGPEYGYRSDYERVSKSQIDMMRRSQPFPLHRSGRGWNEWVLFRDDGVTPFPVIKPEGTDFETEFCTPTAVDLHLFMVDKHLDNALTFTKKTEIPIDGKMLLMVLGAVGLLVFVMLGMFS